MKSGPRRVVELPLGLDPTTPVIKQAFDIRWMLELEGGAEHNKTSIYEVWRPEATEFLCLTTMVGDSQTPWAEWGCSKRTMAACKDQLVTCKHAGVALDWDMGTRLMRSQG